MANLLKYLFTDIETHRVVEWNDLSEALRNAWINHYYKEANDDEDYEQSYNRLAGLYPEFGHVICISIGYESEDGEGNLKLNKITFKGADEKNDILIPLANALEKIHAQGYSLCGWNIAGFDIPFMILRYMINRMEVPAIFNEYGKKPWETSNYDLMQDYKCGRYRATSLEAACAAFGIPCKSGNLSGKNIYELPISEMDWDALGSYCEEDIECPYQLYKIFEKYYFPSE